MEHRLTAALEVLEDQPPGPERAMAYSDLALRIGLYGGRREEGERTAGRAVALAEACADPAALGHVQGRIGLLRALLDADDALLRDCLSRARTAGLHLDAGMAYQGLATGAALRRERATTRRWIDEGIEYLQARDILGPLQYLRGLQAVHELADGNWLDADRTAGWVLAQPEGRGITGVHALETEALLQLRRGRLPQAAETLGELWTVAETCGMLHHVAPAACALAEHADLTGEWAGAVGALRTARTLAQRLGLAQVASETGFWLCRAGALDSAEFGDPDPDDPYALAAVGEWRAAAVVWEQLGCPFERAHALAEADDEEALLTALGLAAGLGADPLAARPRAKLRGYGVQRVPRGPRADTRANPAGLTARQLEVFALLCEGLTDAEIGGRLVLSVKTVNHHVSAVLDKLGVNNRHDAVRMAERTR
jgi:DNA-binding CsgD family transcriptional regulator